MRMFARERWSPPELFRSWQAEEAQSEVQEFISSIGRKGAQRRPPDFSKLFRDRDFLQSLLAVFDHVCAFCETPAAKFGPGWVHHFRPMGLAADERGATSILHYVWLGLDWENIYTCCPQCSRTKGNRFYVASERGEPGLSVWDLREVEREQLIDPCWTDPREHLQCLLNGTYAPRSRIGENTIDVFGLNRGKLIRARKQAIVELANDLRAPSTRPLVRRSETNSVEFPLFIRGEMPEGPPPFAGFTTTAILSWAAAQRIPAETPQAFLAELETFDEITCHELADVIINGGVETPPSTAQQVIITSPPSRAPKPRERRVPRLTELPAQNLPISRVAIRNFKALREVTFELPAAVDDPELMRNTSLELAPCMLILGENATGKSSVLEAMTLALLGTRELGHLDEMLDDDELNPLSMIHRPDLSNWEILAEDPLKVEVGFLDSEDHCRLEGRAEDALFTGSAQPSRILLSYGPRRYFKRRKQRRFRAPAYRCLSQFDPLATIPNPSDWLLTCPDDQFHAAVRALREILMLDNDQDVLRDSGRIVIDTPGGRTPLSELSVGYKSVVALATDIIQELFYYYDNTEYAHAVVLIDEIETHLHPRWKMRIMGLLRQAFPKVQFVVTTHDPLCLRGMYDGEVFVLQRSEEDARVETLTDLPSVRGMRAEQLLTSEFFGLGSTDPETDAKLHRYHRLTAKTAPSAEEQNELSCLGSELSRDLVAGNTIGEQVLVQAMRLDDFDPFEPIQKVTSQSKRDLLAAAMRALDVETDPS